MTSKRWVGARIHNGYEPFTKENEIPLSHRFSDTRLPEGTHSKITPPKSKQLEIKPTDLAQFSRLAYQKGFLLPEGVLGYALPADGVIGKRGGLTH